MTNFLFGIVFGGCFTLLLMLLFSGGKRGENS